jgi:hypothetical protein
MDCCLPAWRRDELLPDQRDEELACPSGKPVAPIKLVGKRMRLLRHGFVVSILCVTGLNGRNRDDAVVPANAANSVIWRHPNNISALDLFYGAGGRDHAPVGPFTFVEEDLDGTNPKFVVTDPKGIRWTVKLGPEAKPETAATRIVWAAGYFSNEVYYLEEIQVRNLPARLHRGQSRVKPNGVLHSVRLKRHLTTERKVGHWTWSENPFTGTREFNGLRVVMSLLNNWDLTDENNAVYEELTVRKRAATVHGERCRIHAGYG